MGEKTANEACCGCGGGSTSGVVNPTAPSPTAPSPTISIPAPTPPTTPPVPSTPSCVDSPENWHDSDGPAFNCQWYGDNGYCVEYGDMYKNFGKTANEACCVCGGGINGVMDETPDPIPIVPPNSYPPIIEVKCGCPSCSGSILDKDIAGNGFKLGDQIEWLETVFNYEEEDACTLICTDFFPGSCNECNPSICT